MSCTMITEVDILLTTPCYVTCAMITEARRLSAHHTLLHNICHDNRGTQSSHHILQPNMYHDNRVNMYATLAYERCYKVER